MRVTCTCMCTCMCVYVSSVCTYEFALHTLMCMHERVCVCVVGSVCTYEYAHLHTHTVYACECVRVCVRACVCTYLKDNHLANCNILGEVLRRISP